MTEPTQPTNPTTQTDGDTHTGDEKQDDFDEEEERKSTDNTPTNATTTTTLDPPTDKDPRDILGKRTRQGYSRMRNQQTDQPTILVCCFSHRT